MNLFIEWLEMGGYFSYVWPAYGLFGAVLALNLFSMKWKRKQTHQKLQQWFKCAAKNSNN